MNDSLMNLLFWKDTSSTYLYGSKLNFLADTSVVFQNELMSPGKGIVAWSSSTDYQADRISPQLPLLKEKHMYGIRLKAKSSPEKTVIMRIDFFGQDNSLIEKKYISDAEGEFLYPKGCYKYTVSLINAGCKSIHFKRIELFALKNIADFPMNDDYQFKSNKKHWDEKKTLNIFFKEPVLNIIPAASTEFLAEQGNYILIDSTFPNGKLFLDERVKNYILNIDYAMDKITCWGNGKYSNFAAAYYRHLLRAAKLEIVETSYTIVDYKRDYAALFSKRFYAVATTII